MTIIAALAKRAGIDVAKPSKAADSIEALTTDIGARVAARTVEDHLKRIPGEVSALNAARISGRSDEEIRALVARLEMDRHTTDRRR